MKTLSICAVVLSISIEIFAHPGRLDADGGHNDRKNGTYHYHRGPKAGSSASASSIPKEQIKPMPLQSERPIARVRDVSPVIPMARKKSEESKGGPPESTLGPEFDERKRVLEYQQRMAAKGDAQAQYAMGLRYLNGIDVPKDEEKAAEFLKGARAAGDLRARDKMLEIERAKRKAQAELLAASK